jgi:hypothetical protein
VTKVITVPTSDRLPFPELGKSKRRHAQGWTTADFRRTLSELNLRPPSQRAFLRKLLNRALFHGANKEFLVPNHSVRDPVSPS